MKGWEERSRNDFLKPWKDVDTLQIASKEGRSQNYVPPLQGYTCNNTSRVWLLVFFSFFVHGNSSVSDVHINESKWKSSHFIVK